MPTIPHLRRSRIEKVITDAAGSEQDFDQAAAQLALCRIHPEAEYFEHNRGLDLFQRTEVDFEISHESGFDLKLRDWLGL